ncbi:MAG TPA: hypothetical protein VGL69_17715 [Solirubrobacteraceae bacterium]|jgi:hypothetical protein
MSTNPISTDLTHAFSQSVRDARHANVKPSTPATSAGESVTRDAIPSAPPQEVFAAMLTAAQNADRLAASGRALHFSTDETTGLSVQLTTLDGTVLGTVAPSTVLSVASGDALD